MNTLPLHEGIPQRVVVRLAILSEGLILLVSLLWVWIRGISIPVEMTYEALYQGIRATGPLIAFNFGVFGVLANAGEKYQIYREFRDQIVYPLCRHLTVAGALVVALFSGVAEEILFRGVMHTELTSILPPIVAIIIISLLFAYVHFIGMLRRFVVVFWFYFLFGLYFAYLIEWTGNLLVPIVTHALYNFLAIICIRYFIKPTSNGLKR